MSEVGSTNESRKILIVEDETTLRELYERLLRRHGHQITVVTNGAAALEVLKDKTFDLILLDIMLPRVDGLGVLKQLNEDPSYNPQILSHVVMLTNLSHEQVVMKAISKGIRGYLVKSDYDPEQFLAAVSEFLD